MVENMAFYIQCIVLHVSNEIVSVICVDFGVAETETKYIYPFCSY